MAFLKLPRTTDVRTYPELLRLVKETLFEGQQRIEAEKVRTYWETGYYIQQHILQNNDRAEYGAEVIPRLADDLGLGERLLYRCLRFVERYPDPLILSARTKFTWTHYRELITVADDKARARLEELADKSEWSTDELVAQIRSEASSQQSAVSSERSQQGSANSPSPAASCPLSAAPLVPLRGQLYTYQITKRKVISSGATELVVDLGFSNYRDVDARLISNFSDGDVVQSIPKEDAYRFSKIDRTAKDLYTYNAYVEKVIDGDTLKVHIDLGFATWTRQSLRLRGIDCPELKTSAGDEAKAFVQSHLKATDQIVIRSIKPDKFDRYLADVFIPGEDGADVFLNNLLLEKGHAVRWEE